MRPREKPTEPGETPKQNTSGMLSLFVRETLKRGYSNHDALRQVKLEVRELQVRGRFYDGWGILPLEISGEGVLAFGMPIHWPTWPRRHTCPAGWRHPPSRPVPDVAPTGDWGDVCGELRTFYDSTSRLEGFRPSGCCLCRRVLVPASVNDSRELT